MTRARYLLCTMILTGCNFTADPSRPISLVADKALSKGDLQVLARAAEGWNHEFGTKIAVVADDGESFEQPVRVSRSAHICDEAAGLAHMTDRLAIDLCSTVDSMKPVFVVARHEIGHILGLDHAETDPAAVMAPSRQVDLPRFRPIDRELFFDAHPSFGGNGNERVARFGSYTSGLVADSPDDFVFAQADNDQIRLRRVDLRSGELSDAGKIDTSELVRWLRVRSSKDRFDLSWVEEGVLRFAELDRSGKISQSVPIAVPLSFVLDDLQLLSVVRHGDDLFVATSQYRPTHSRSVQLHRFAAATGAPRELDFASFGALAATYGPPLYVSVLRAAFVTVPGPSGSDDLYLTQVTTNGLVLHRVVDGRSVSKISANTSTDNHLVVVGGGSGALVMAWQPRGEPDRLVLQRVLTRPELAFGVRRVMKLPSGGAHSRVAVAVNARTDQLALAITRRDQAWGESGIFATAIYASSFADVNDWQRLSTLDLIQSEFPRVVDVDDRFFITWQDDADDIPVETRGRFFGP